MAHPGTQWVGVHQRPEGIEIGQPMARVSIQGDYSWDSDESVPDQQRREQVHGGADQAVQHLPGPGASEPRRQPPGAEAEPRESNQTGTAGAGDA
jgi:hypothetical protein